ncbi:hypothetical protein [Rathayibacter sp. VKM Ac-2760]|uniref:hypothetical protein n=1 Tax=Rathayibacter sp. VKM Ac-2760 TaxID=2609253 RepID=UPI001315DAEC|nr:hypothetical protein [Rathayibacter sp. VKM Ac-2760]QHC61224.1 hypothetical protein GSU72_21125 [Rathayibacter sp. VKM Ac-2760]
MTPVRLVSRCPTYETAHTDLRLEEPVHDRRGGRGAVGAGDGDYWRQQSETVTVPAFTNDGQLIEARLTLDAGSELVAVLVDLQLVDADEASASEAAVTDIHSRIRVNERTVAHPVIDNEPPFPFYDEYNDRYKSGSPAQFAAHSMGWSVGSGQLVEIERSFFPSAWRYP